MIDFSTLQGVTIPEGAVTQIESGGVVLWKLDVGGGPIVLEVEKVTSDTYAGGTTYTGESFILLDIYPNTNGTVNVTYGGLTKTITDTSGAESPNIQSVFFGTFNGESDNVATPESGKLTIEGDFSAFAGGTYFASSKNIPAYAACITAVIEFGNVPYIPYAAFGGCAKLTDVQLPDSIKSIENVAFQNCTGLTTMNIPDGVKSIGMNVFSGCTGLTAVVFENVTGWYVTETQGAASGTVVYVSDPTNNATLLTDTYKARYWYRA